jgi:hypothetical protein
MVTENLAQLQILPHSDIKAHKGKQVMDGSSKPPIGNKTSLANGYSDHYALTNEILPHYNIKNQDATVVVKDTLNTIIFARTHKTVRQSKYCFDGNNLTFDFTKNW